MNTAATNLSALAQAIRNAHAKCQAGLRQTLTDAIACGKLLAEAKAAVPHGSWLPWLEANTTMSVRTAQAFMRLASREDELLQANAQPVALLGVREALEALAEPTGSRVERLKRLERAIVECIIDPEFQKARAGLFEIKQRKLWREADTSFEAYCLRRWELDAEMVQVILAMEVAA